VDSNHVVTLLSSLLDAKLSKFSDESGPSENTACDLNIASKYESFLRECNAVDLADVYTAVTSACAESVELANVISQTCFLIVNPQFQCHIEVNVFVLSVFSCSIHYVMFGYCC